MEDCECVLRGFSHKFIDFKLRHAGSSSLRSIWVIQGGTKLTNFRSRDQWELSQSTKVLESTTVPLFPCLSFSSTYLAHCKREQDLLLSINLANPICPPWHCTETLPCPTPSPGQNHFQQLQTLHTSHRQPWHTPQSFPKAFKLGTSSSQPQLILKSISRGSRPEKFSGQIQIASEPHLSGSTTDISI